ncbi:MAG TPA: hypothetical protein VH107_14985 [Lacipirellulaceae bacterium]|nr:hypothetical protein [Lacipirellulaceae bacterium]
MIATVNDSHRYDTQFEDSDNCDRFERFTYRSAGEFPVRSQTARSRAKLRGRATHASRNKARSFNGANRRGRGRQWAANC